MPKTRTLILATLLGTAAAAPARAQADAQDSDIIVLGSGLAVPPGTPAYGSIVIDRERLSNSASGRIESVLADVAGFQQFRRSDSRSANPSAQGATLRALGGNASTRALVLLDGVPMTDPFFGYVPFSALVPDRLAAIRVTRGGGAGAFGAGAVAGTIELASASADALPLFSGSAFYGSRDAQELSATLTPELGAGFASLSGRYERGDGFLTTPRSQRVAATAPAAYESWSTGLRAVAPLGDGIELQARMLAFRDERTLRFRGADSSSEGQDASVRLVARGPWQVDAVAYVQARNFTNIVISATSFNKTLDQRDTPSTGYGGKIEIRPPVGDDHALRIGADLRGARGTMYEDAFNANTGAVTARRAAGGHQSTTGFFVENDWTLGKLVLTGGMRADRWSISSGRFEQRNGAGTVTIDNRFADRSDWQWSGRAGLLFRASETLALRGAGYTGFRLPTLNELYRPFQVFPVTTQANAALKPERLKGAEVGMDLEPATGVHLGLTAFWNRLDNAIANVTIGTNQRQRQNVDAIVAKGIELTASTRLSDFMLLASYAYSHSRVRGAGPSLALDGFIPAQSPAHAASATLGWARGGYALSTTLRYVGKQYEDDLETDVLPDALTVDAVGELPVAKGVSLVARGENLFDARVVTRNVAGSMDLGTPRTFWIGFRIAR